MSWDVLLHRFPQDLKTPQDLPKDFKPTIIGSRSEVIQSIRAIFPAANISDPSWIVIDGSDYSIEINLGDKEFCDGFMLHVRGSDGALPAVIQIADRLKLRALDMTSCEFLDKAVDPAKGFRQWRGFRDKTFGDT